MLWGFYGFRVLEYWGARELYWVGGARRLFWAAWSQGVYWAGKARVLY